MTPLFERHDLADGITLYAASTARFKSIAVKLRFIEPLDARAAMRAIVVSLLRRGCVSAPDLMSIARRAESLYGASFMMDVGRIGEMQASDFGLQVAHPKFLDEPRTLVDSLAFLRELIEQPVLEDGGFRAHEFEQERSNLLRAIAAIFDDKASWSHVRLIECMFAGEPYARLDHGTIAEVNSLDRCTSWSEHRRRVRETPLDLFAIGDLGESRSDSAVLDPLRAIGEFGSAFSARASRTRSFEYESAPHAPRSQTPRQIVEPIQAAESHLLIGHRFDAKSLDPRGQLAMSVFATMLGGGAHSLLFSELRERAGLAYSTNAHLDRVKGFLAVYAGIARDRFEEARDRMRDLVARCAKGEFDDGTYSAAIATLRHSIRTALDSPGRAIEFASRAVATGWPPDPVAYSTVLDTLDRAAVIEAANRVREDVCFLAAGRTDANDRGTEQETR